MSGKANSGNRHGGIGRRGVIIGAGAAAAASQLKMPFIGNAAAAEPIKIGMIWAKTGSIVDQAEYLAQGGLLALEQRNNTLLGRPAEIVWLDEPNPQGAQQNAERLVGEHKVVGIVGGALSSFALAISAVAKKAKIPYVAANAATGALTGASCNKYTFRLQPPVDVHTRVLAPYCASIGKKWYTLTAAYAFGQDIKRSSPTTTRPTAAPSSAPTKRRSAPPDFSSFILKIRAAKPDVVIGGIAASDLTTFLKQWNELGMSGKIPFAEIAVGNTDLWGVGPEAADGLFTITWWLQESEQSARGAGVCRRPTRRSTTARRPTRHGWAGYGMKCAARLDRAGEIDRARRDRRGARELEVSSAAPIAIGYRKFDHQMTEQPAGRRHQAEDHRQVGLFRRQGRAAAKDAEIEKAFGTRPRSPARWTGSDGPVRSTVRLRVVVAKPHFRIRPVPSRGLPCST